MTTQADALERYMLDLINAERAAVGRAPLQLEQNLNQSAEDHSEWMLQRDIFSHTGVGGSSAGDRMRDADFTFAGSWSWGENIGFQSERGAPGLFDDVEDIHGRLMNSSGHRANILSANFDYVGIGIEFGNYNGFDGVMITQNFARTAAPVTLDTGAVAPAPPAPAPVVAPPSNTPPPPPAAPAPEPEPEAIRGTSGRDLLEGTREADEIFGGAGRDTVQGGAGEDTIFGGDGRDDLEGGAGDDVLHGGNGNDWLRGGDGADELRGGRGADVADYVYAETGVIADLQFNGANAGGALGDTYFSISRLRGSAHDDWLRGDGGTNKLIGGAGDDTLEGRGGNDTLDASSGRDVLRGGAGDDILLGRSGADRFVFETGMDSDVIRDFEDDHDLLDFRNMGFASRDALMARGDQMGDDVVFDLMGGDMLRIENATLAQLQDDLLI